MIPKTIHYCWFGRNPLPPLAVKCIKSWKKYCHDYEIIEWNEDNFDISSAPLYVRQAYEAKKWAFVTDYVRLYAMVNFGGIYMDTDVEVIRPLDKFLHHQAFSGFEEEKRIPTGIMACEKDFPLFNEFLHFYDSAVFVRSDGSYDQTPNVRIMTDICLQYGLQQNGTYQVIEDLALYPPAYFCPINPETGLMKKTRKTHTIHWFSASWFDEERKQDRINYFKKKQAELRQTKRINLMHNISHLPNRILHTILGDVKYEKLKQMIKRWLT